ncbi:MAG: RsmB/NOP family class I SAM-dependent RNA methyltransferase [Candidatus Aenigmarchaeota archaeon]|nr:RsmB/NOP family class I SAM-dependent RNA methyltransferase [Candidatus Aenigmarchaeota archaeon]
MTIIPPRFKECYAPLVADPEAFFASLLTPAPKAFRVNTLKTTTEHVKKRFALYGIGIHTVPWSPDVCIADNPSIGSTLEHALGHIYLQELTSMIPPLLVAPELAHAQFVLDACAAPGSKTTQLAALMQNRGTIVANDIDSNRVRALQFNLEKSGVCNTVVTHQDLRTVTGYAFDAIILDVPCSLEGTIRKDPIVLSHWSEQTIAQHAHLQKQLIVHAFDLLAENGTLVYSTCTFAPEENEAVVSELLTRRPAHLVPIALPGLVMRPGVTSWNGKTFDQRVAETRRIFPHDNNTGGFFVAQVKK